MTSSIDETITKRSEEISQIDDKIIIEVTGVAMAIDHLRKALDKVDECLTEREFEQASSLGYSEVSTEFIFLQRTLGGLQSAVNESQKLISDIAMESGNGSYEETEAVVKPHMMSLQPRKELSDEERQKSKEWLEKRMKKLRSKRSKKSKE